MKPLDPRLLRYARSSRVYLFLTVVIAITSAVFTITQAYLLTKIIVGIFQKHADFAGIKSSLIALIAVFIARTILSYFTEWLGAIASSRMRNELRLQLLNKALTTGAGTVNEMGSTQLSVLATRGINNLDGYFAKFIPQLFIASIVPVMVGITIATEDMQSGIIVLFTIPLIPIFGAMIGRYTAAVTMKRWKSLEILSGYFADLLKGMRTLKVYGRADLQTEKLKAVGAEYQAETMRVLKISFLSSLALELIATLSVALLAVSIGLRLVSGSLTLSVGLFILIISPEVYWPIRQVAGYFHAAADGIAAFNQIYAILDNKEVVGTIKIEGISAISWSAITVEYPDRTSIHIPAGQIKSGEFQALIGASGSGKSTLVKILLGFLSPTSGEVSISTSQGTFALEDIDPTSLRSLISWLPQDPHFAIGTISQALRQVSPLATDAELTQLLSDVGLDLADLNHGLDTELGKLQQGLSVGQLRKVGLARAILKKSPVLILDEPSASVDDASEAIISQLVQREAANGRIVLMISHRPLLADAAHTTIDMARAR
ncbi:MAG: thiol reductant ABC exporter subunit CydD [Actinomycetes bacterium]